nr:metal-sensitive transcriptional regulator [Limobrevibacterium gyesilva]
MGGLGHGDAPWLRRHHHAEDDGTTRLPYIPHRGIVSRSGHVHEATKAAVVTRLRRIEGQVGGLLRMVDEDRYCVDVLTQINAVRAALHKVEEQILRDHVSHCVAEAFMSGDVNEQRHKVDELVATVARMTR